MLNVIGDSGKTVDWWFMYKVSKESHTTTGQTVTGGEYAYFDSSMSKQRGAKLVLSKKRVDKQNGALHETLGQLFTEDAKATRSLGWYCYNDEDQLDDDGEITGDAERGHCKGVLAFDLESNSAFWLIHSVPMFPMTTDANYPASGLSMAQTSLCISLPDVGTAKSIAQLMFDAHGPNVNLSSDLLLKSLTHPNGFSKSEMPMTDVLALLQKDDPRILLMQNLNGSLKKPKPYSGRIAFHSRAGEKFLAIAKNKAWGNPKLDRGGEKDFYDDLVGPVLKEDIAVEDWAATGSRIPAEVERGDKLRVESMRSVNLTSQGIPFSWSSKVDPGRVAIADRSNPESSHRWVCVGDINFADALDAFGGGTVAFKCQALWTSLAQAICEEAEAVPPHHIPAPPAPKKVAVVEAVSSPVLGKKTRSGKAEKAQKSSGTPKSNAKTIARASGKAK